ncbi:MAG: hypothetical protein Aurels2KO_22290 [Aureliella sp.]
MRTANILRGSYQVPILGQLAKDLHHPEHRHGRIVDSGKAGYNAHADLMHHPLLHHISNMHTIQVALLPEFISKEEVRAASLAIVIDTLRFTTTAVAALESGADSVRTCKEVATARELATENPDWKLCGERDCKPIEGFAMGNSPLEYVEEVVSGKQLVFTTTNGTRAVAAALPAGRIVLASLTNRASICDLLKSQPENQPSIIFCAGTDGLVAMEDVMTAGAIIAGADCASEGDSCAIAVAAWENATSRAEQRSIESEVERVFRTCRGGASLVTKGYERDLAAAARLDSATAIPVAESPGVTDAAGSSVCFRKLSR